MVLLVREHLDPLLAKDEGSLNLETQVSQGVQRGLQGNIYGKVTLTDHCLCQELLWVIPHK